jgi:hypothetical protein
MQLAGMAWMVWMDGYDEAFPTVSGLPCLIGFIISAVEESDGGGIMREII